MIADATTAADVRAERMDRVALLFAEISAATRGFLAALAESDHHGDWAEEGFGSCAEWLAWRVGITLNTANEKIRAARALESLPLISGAMSRGELSFSKVRALTRVATAQNEGDLLAFAQAGSAANLERVIRSWRWGSRGEELAEEVVRHRNRNFSVFPDEEGMYVVKGRVPPDVGAVLMRAIEAASDALFARSPAGAPSSPEPAQLRADALGLLAERALAAGFGADAPVSGSRAERYQVVLHVDPETLSEAGELGQSELGDGTRVTAETARRLACDSGLVQVARGAEDRSVLGVGRKTRTVPPAVRRALEARDRGCRFPGCGLRFTDAHHVRHWADGGETSLRNLVLLCRRHHRRVHEEGHRVCLDRKGQVMFFTPKGRPMFEVPEEGATRGATCGVPETQPAAESVALPASRSREVGGNAWGQAPRWKRDADVPWHIEGAAAEAVAAAHACPRAPQTFAR